jgi:hypothetical protein
MSEQEIKKPHLNQAKLNKWYEMQEQVRDLKEKEAELRKEIFQSAFPNAKEGTNKLELAEGWVLNATLPINRKVDLAAFQAMKEQLLEHHIKVDQIVEFKPELSVKQYRCLTEEEVHLVDQFLIISEGSPQMKVVLPKKAAKKL